MQMLIDSHGAVRCLYDETIDLARIGPLRIERGSYVEPDTAGSWLADLSPVAGPVLGPFLLRSEALEAERLWLERHWLTGFGFPG